MILTPTHAKPPKNIFKTVDFKGVPWESVGFDSHALPPFLPAKSTIFTIQNNDDPR